MSEQQTETKSEAKEVEYTHLYVPKAVKEEWVGRAKSEGLAVWRMLHKCFTFYYSAWRKHFNFAEVEGGEELSEGMSKAIWYIVKLGMSAGAFKERRNQINYDKLMTNINEIEKRLGIDLSDLKIAVDQLKAQRRRAYIITLNQALMSAVAKIIQKGLEDLRKEKS